jgi:hypothetical protein
VTEQRQEPLFDPDSASAATPAMSSFERVDKTVQRFLDRTWRTAELLVESENGDALFAVGRAYYGVYAVVLNTALMLDIELLPYQNNSAHHIQRNAVPHSQVPALASRLQNLMTLPLKLGSRSAESDATFSLVRQLQKMRMRADYMGTETLTREAARAYVAQAKEFCAILWRYTRAHSS